MAGSDLSPQQHYALAQQLHQARRWAEAERHYRAVLAQYGGYGGVLVRLAEVCLHQGKASEAEGFYRHAVAAMPQDVAAHAGLGCALNALGRYAEALPEIDRALASEPRRAGWHLDRGNALSALGRTGEALDAYLAAAARNPRWASPHYNAANMLTRLGRLDEAVVQYQAALELHPDDVACLNNLGACLLKANKPRAAATCYERIFRIKPDFAPAYNNQGRALADVQQFEAAIHSFRRAIELDPRSIDARNGMASAMIELGRADEALNVYQSALALAPDNAATWLGLGSCLQSLGRFDEAKAALERAVALKPDAPAPWYTLVRSRKITAADPAVAALERLAEKAADYPAEERAKLHFALAKIYDDLGRYDEAFARLRLGNEVHRRQIAYDEARELAGMERIAREVSAEFLGSRPDAGNPSELPVFILGMPRSGTTLVEQILSSHPDVFGAGELTDLTQIMVSDMDEGVFPFAAAPLTQERVRMIGERYVAQLRCKSATAARVTDKMPANFLAIGVIRLALPRARIIHVHRDPRDTCFSCYDRLFSHGQYFSYRLGELGRYYRAYEGLMAHWRSVLPPGAMYEVRYEDLIDDFDAEARKLVAYCGLDWNDSCAAFYENKRSVATASLQQVRQPIYRSSLGRWRPYAEHLRPLFEALGMSAAD